MSQEPHYIEREGTQNIFCLVPECDCLRRRRRPIDLATARFTPSVFLDHIEDELATASRQNASTLGSSHTPSAATPQLNVTIPSTPQVQTPGGPDTVPNTPYTPYTPYSQATDTVTSVPPTPGVTTPHHGGSSSDPIPSTPSVNTPGSRARRRRPKRSGGMFESAKNAATPFHAVVETTPQSRFLRSNQTRRRYDLAVPQHNFVMNGPGTVNPSFSRRAHILRQAVPILQMPPVPNTVTVFSQTLIGTRVRLNWETDPPEVWLNEVSHDVFWLGPPPSRDDAVDLKFVAVEQESGGSVTLSDGSEFENPDLDEPN